MQDILPSVFVCMGAQGTMRVRPTNRELKLCTQSEFGKRDEKICEDENSSAPVYMNAQFILALRLTKEKMMNEEK